MRIQLFALVVLPFTALDLHGDPLPSGAIVRLGTIKSYAVSFSPDSNLLASGGWENDKTIRLWDVATSKVVRTFTGHKTGITSLWFSPNGKMLASAGEDSTVRLWDVATGKEIRKWTAHEDAVHSVCFSPNGKVVASGGSDGIVRLWDVATGEEIRTYRGHKGGTYSVNFVPDGKTLASAGEDRTVRLWDVNTGKAIRKWTAHDGEAFSVYFSPDGKMLASAGEDKSVRLWDVATGKEIRSYTGNEARVMAVGISPDGKVLASAGWDKMVRLWDVATGKEIRTYNENQGRVSDVTFSPDGKLVASANDETPLLIWKVPGRQVRVTKEISLEAAKQCWSDLSSSDITKVYAAIEAMTSSHERTVLYLKTAVNPVQPLSPADEKRISTLISDLDNPEISVRQKAEEELAKFGSVAVLVLREALKGKVSVEARTRIERLVERLEGLTPETLRALRAVQVLEYIGTPEAKDILKTLAEGAAEARLTQQAQASLQRLNRRSPKNP